MPSLPRCLRASVLFAALVLLGACGGGDDDPAAEVTTTTTTTMALPEADVTVIAEDIKFPTGEFTAKAGEITIAYKNEGRIRHTLVIEGVDGFETLAVDDEGDVDSGAVTLAAGEYTIYCDIPGHRGNGMEGTLTVE